MTSTISCFKRIWRKKSKLRGAELWKAEFLAAGKTCSVIFWSTPSFRERPIDVWILKRAYFHFGIHITLIIMRSWLFRRFIQPCHKAHWRGVGYFGITSIHFTVFWHSPHTWIFTCSGPLSWQQRQVRSCLSSQSPCTPLPLAPCRPPSWWMIKR